MSAIVTVAVQPFICHPYLQWQLCQYPKYEQLFNECLLPSCTKTLRASISPPLTKPHPLHSTHMPSRPAVQGWKAAMQFAAIT